MSTPSTQFAKESNRYTGKGPGKLSFYCDACQRQCGDKLGYERHCNSKEHIKRTEWIAENPLLYLENNSTSFENAFLNCLKLRGTQLVDANTVYQDLLHDKHHIHMKSTKWDTLTDFVRHLDNTKKCRTEFIEGQGWCLAYVEHDEELLAKQRHANAKRSLLSNAITTLSQEYYKQRETNNIAATIPSDEHQTLTQSTNDKPTVQGPLSLSFTTKSTIINPSKRTNVFDDDGDDDDDDNDGDNDNGDGNDHQSVNNQDNNHISYPLPPTEININNTNQSSDNNTNHHHDIQHSNEPNPSKRKLIDDLAAVNAQTTSTTSNPTTNVVMKKSRTLPTPAPWLRLGLIVKITNDQLKNGEYYGCKGVITKLFTSIDKKLVLVDPSLRQSTSNIDSNNHITTDDDDINSSFITLSDGKKICIDYGYAFIGEVTLSNQERLLLPQSQLQTTVPKSLNPQPDNLALVSGQYADVDSEQLRMVKLISLDNDNFEAQVQLIDPWFQRYSNQSLVQLTSSDNSTQWNSIVTVSVDDICSIK